MTDTIISTPNALVQTTNGKRFYVYSGVVSVPNSETALISIDNIGERDIKISFQLGSDNQNTDEFDLLVKSNGIIIFNLEVGNTGQPYANGTGEYKFILPANSSLEVTLESSSANRNWTVTGHGKYLSMD